MTTGNFFIVDQRLWGAVCEADDINAACAWLLLMQGTGGNQRTTAWSVDSIMRYLGMGYSRAKAAVDKLRVLKFIRHGEKHTQRFPRYDLLDYAEWKTETGKAKKGRPRAAEESTDANLIWLPNELITGTEQGEKSPIHKLRAAGDRWALRLFIDLYHEHNLRDDGGIARKYLLEKYDAARLQLRGSYRIMRFTSAGKTGTWAGPLLVHRARPAPDPKSHPIWDSVHVLEQTGVMAFIPHLLENDEDHAEVIHPFGIGGHGEHPIETQIGSEARAAAIAMCTPRQLGDDQADRLLLCPVSRDYPKAQMVGIARLHYRPHTKRSSAWARNLEENGRGYIEQFQRLAAEYAERKIVNA